GCEIDPEQRDLTSERTAPREDDLRTLPPPYWHEVVPECGDRLGGATSDGIERRLLIRSHRDHEPPVGRDDPGQKRHEVHALTAEGPWFATGSVLEIESRAVTGLGCRNHDTTTVWHPRRRRMTLEPTARQPPRRTRSGRNNRDRRGDSGREREHGSAVRRDPRRDSVCEP